MDSLTEIEAEELVRPLFPNRRPHECCWPMWGDSRDIETKRVCGALVPARSKIPYCPDHLDRQEGAGSTAERTAIAAARSIAKRGAS